MINNKVFFIHLTEEILSQMALLLHMPSILFLLIVVGEENEKVKQKQRSTRHSK